MNLRYSIMLIGSMLLAKPFSQFVFTKNVEIQAMLSGFYVLSSLLWYGYFLKDEVVE